MKFRIPVFVGTVYAIQPYTKGAQPGFPMPIGNALARALRLAQSPIVRSMTLVSDFSATKSAGSTREVTWSSR